MQNYRIKNKQISDGIKELQKLIEDSAVPASKNFDDDLKSIMSNADTSKARKIEISAVIVYRCSLPPGFNSVLPLASS